MVFSFFYASLKVKFLVHAQNLIKHKKPIVTAILPLREFYPAEDYHQEYYRKNPKRAYCQLIINLKLEKMTGKFTAWLKK